MVIKTGLSNFSANISRGYSSISANRSLGNNSGGSSSFRIGKVFGVILGENIPSKEQFDRVGGYNGIGAILYLDFNSSKYQKAEEIDLNECRIAYPLDPNIKNFPILEELILLVDGPSVAGQVFGGAGFTYYISPINVWNNPQQNAPVYSNRSYNFIESADIRPLNPFPGDLILQGRKGNGIRFGTTNKNLSDKNEWSSVGNDGDPILILANGYVTTDTGSQAPNIEEINKEKSSIYMTTSQQLPLIPGTDILNPGVNTLSSQNYINPQIILNSDRVTLNSKKDEVLLFSKTNIELNADDIINLNAKKRIHLHTTSDYSIFLGTGPNGSFPNEPVLLGNQTLIAFEKIANALINLGSYLATVNTPQDAAVICKQAGTQLLSDIDSITKQLEKIPSTKVFTV